jgi:hypothetical protein
MYAVYKAGFIVRPGIINICQRINAQKLVYFNNFYRHTKMHQGLRNLQFNSIKEAIKRHPKFLKSA